MDKALYTHTLIQIEFSPLKMILWSSCKPQFGQWKTTRLQTKKFLDNVSKSTQKINIIMMTVTF